MTIGQTDAAERFNMEAGKSEKELGCKIREGEEMLLRKDLKLSGML